MFQVKPVNYNVVKWYIENNRTPGTTLPPWVRAVEDTSTAEALLTHHSFRGHKAFGCYLSGAMIGYAIVYTPRRHLEVMQMSPKFRGKGYGKLFLNELDIVSVNVDRDNTGAVRLYESMGYELEYDD